MPRSILNVDVFLLASVLHLDWNSTQDSLLAVCCTNGTLALIKADQGSFVKILDQAHQVLLFFIVIKVMVTVEFN